MGAPAAVAIAFAAAATAVAGATYVGQKQAASNQLKIDEAGIELQREQSRLQAAEAGQQHAVGFRKALASQVALASMRGGAGSVVRQFGSESYSNFLNDQEAIKRGVRLADLQSTHAYAQAYANRSASNLRATSQFATSTLNAWNLSGIGQGGGAKGGATTQAPKSQGGK